MGFFSQLGRDMKSLVSGMFKDKPAPFVEKQAEESHRGHGPSRSLHVAKVVRETDDAITMVLQDPQGAPIAFEAGQFFTIVRKVGDKTVRRSYSASSPAHLSTEVHLTVKQVPGGLVSPELVKALREGDVLEVAGPAGNFTVPAGKKRLVLIGGGSGITPLMSIVRTHLEADPSVRIDLLYGSRSERDIIFKAALAELAQANGERLRVRHVLEQPHESAARVGRLDRATVTEELEAIGAFADEGTMFFVCGPVGMMDEAKAALEARKIPAARLKEERFISPGEGTNEGSSETQAVTVHMSGRDYRVSVKPGLTILEAAQDQGVDMPFSCTVGGCASCRVKLRSGKVSLGEPNCLDPDEKADGYILACVSKPLEPCVVEVE